LEDQFLEYLSLNKGVIFICYYENAPIGFAQCQLRHDYVEGTKTSPVAYLEGIYIKEEYRLKNLARDLLSNCEKWAIQNNCTEIASDCEIDNNISFEFHKKCGFEEANRIICFTKKL
jgi:aminoglycoside 6'-N-acetyltransferase I